MAMHYLPTLSVLLLAFKLIEHVHELDLDLERATLATAVSQSLFRRQAASVSALMLMREHVHE